MRKTEVLTQRFEQQRPQLRKVAYRLLGSAAEADDAVQEAWLRLARTEPHGVENLDAWLTTVVGRVALNMLRSRSRRREKPLDAFATDPVIASVDHNPEEEALIADSVGLALLVVLDALNPAERLAFVLHDMFAVPFTEIAAIVGRSPDAARQLASRARRRVRDAPTPSDSDVAQQREVVEAFLAATREGDFRRLVAVLDPDVVLRVDRGASGTSELRGAQAVAKQAAGFRRISRSARLVLVNGAPGLVAGQPGRPAAVLAFAVQEGRIARIDVLAERSRLRDFDRLSLASGAA